MQKQVMPQADGNVLLVAFQVEVVIQAYSRKTWKTYYPATRSVYTTSSEEKPKFGNWQKNLHNPVWEIDFMKSTLEVDSHWEFCLFQRQTSTSRTRERLAWINKERVHILFTVETIFELYTDSRIRVRWEPGTKHISAMYRGFTRFKKNN